MWHESRGICPCHEDTSERLSLVSVLGPSMPCLKGDPKEAGSLLFVRMPQPGESTQGKEWLLKQCLYHASPFS